MNTMKVHLSLQNNFSGLSSQNRVFGIHLLDESNVVKRSKSNDVYIKEDNSKNINRPTESVSFGGSAVLSESEKEAEKKNTFKKKVALGIGVSAALIAGTTALVMHLKKAGGGNLAKGLALSQKLYDAAAFSEEHEAFVKNAIALGLAGILKPICVLAMPGADEKDKQFTATKNCLSAFIGFGLTSAILGPINYGVDRFMKNPEIYLPKGHKLIDIFQNAKNKPYTIDISKKPKFTLLDRLKGKTPPQYSDYADAFKIVYKNGLGIITAPLKAYLTIKSMPFILKVVFGEDRKKKKEPQEQPMYMQVLNQPNMLPESENDKNIKKTFAMFSVGGAA